MTTTRKLIAATAATVALAAAVAAPGEADATGNGPEASAAAIYLTTGEAKQVTRRRIRRNVNEEGDGLGYREVGPCWRLWSRRVRCEFYYEATDYDDDFEYYCEGVMQVTETARYYGARAVGGDCDAF